MFAWLPLVKFRAHQQQCHRQTSADRLGDSNHIRFDTRLFKAEEGTGTTVTHLDIINNEKNIEVTTQLFQLT